MSDFEMIHERPKKPIEYTIDRDYVAKMKSEFERRKREKEENLESEIDKLLKIMEEQDKAFAEQGKKPIELEYDEKGYVVVNINDKRQMKLWNDEI